MNNETNHPDWARTADERFLAWLLQGLTDDGFAPTAGSAPDLDAASADPSIAIGDEPTVQHRFQALLKRRIQQELQDNLPLFPWETEVLEYATDPMDAAIADGVPQTAWLTQLQHQLGLPIALPTAQLAQLLDRCQHLAQTSLRQGERLVAAVEDLFPDRADELNLWTERMLMWSASRGGDRLLEPSEGSFPDTYDTATPTQQMLLSLLAAKEIVETLSLNLSASQPRDRRQWFADRGVLELEAEYRPASGNGADTAQLRAFCQLPDGGRVELHGDRAIASAQRRDPGTLAVELADVQPGQTYRLVVHLDGSEPSPLVFAICPTA